MHRPQMKYNFLHPENSKCKQNNNCSSNGKNDVLFMKHCVWGVEVEVDTPGVGRCARCCHALPGCSRLKPP